MGVQDCGALLLLTAHTTPPDVAEVRSSHTDACQAVMLTVAILAQGTSWAVAATQAFLGVGSSPGARTTLAPKHTLQ